MTRRDWLLVAIAQAGDRGLSPLQTQKTMFLLKMEAGEHVGRDFYAFEPYNYGPFSSTIYRDVDLLALSGTIRSEDSGRYSLYVATPAGRERAAALLKNLDSAPRDYLTAVVRWVTSVDFAQLLRSIYAKYPEYAKKSLFRH